MHNTPPQFLPLILSHSLNYYVFLLFGIQTFNGNSPGLDFSQAHNFFLDLIHHRDALKARNNLFAEGVMGLAAALSRPMLCLFDRNFDLGAALQHVWTYKPLVSVSLIFDF